MEAFDYNDSHIQANINEVRIPRVRRLEERAEAIREREETRFMGRGKLTKQPFVRTLVRGAPGDACGAFQRSAQSELSSSPFSRTSWMRNEMFGIGGREGRRVSG